MIEGQACWAIFAGSSTVPVVVGKHEKRTPDFFNREVDPEAREEDELDPIDGVLTTDCTDDHGYQAFAEF